MRDEAPHLCGSSTSSITRCRCTAAIRFARARSSRRSRRWGCRSPASPARAMPREAAIDEGAWETHDGLRFFRGGGLPAGAPVISEIREVRSFAKAIERAVEDFQPDILHAHSPVLTALAARGVREAARPAAALRDPRLLGGCGGRQRHRQRRLAALPRDARARDVGGQARRCGRGDLRGAARRSRVARRASRARSWSRPTASISACSAIRRRPIPRCAPNSGSTVPRSSASSARSTIMRVSTI